MIVDKIRTCSFKVVVLQHSCSWPKIVKHAGLMTPSVPVPSQHPNKLPQIDSMKWIRMFMIKLHTADVQLPVTFLSCIKGRCWTQKDEGLMILGFTMNHTALATHVLVTALSFRIPIQGTSWIFSVTIKLKVAVLSCK